MTLQQLQADSVNDGQVDFNLVHGSSLTAVNINLNVFAAVASCRAGIMQPLLQRALWTLCKHAKPFATYDNARKVVA